MNIGTTLSVTYCRIAGTVLAMLGLLGFVLSATGSDKTAMLGLQLTFGLNVVHLLAGSALLVVGMVLADRATLVTMLAGIAFTAFGAWGIVSGPGFDPLGIVGAVGIADSTLHMLAGLAGLAVWVAMRSEEAHGTA